MANYLGDHALSRRRFLILSGGITLALGVPTRKGWLETIGTSDIIDLHPDQVVIDAALWRGRPVILVVNGAHYSVLSEATGGLPALPADFSPRCLSVDDGRPIVGGSLRRHVDTIHYTTGNYRELLRQSGVANLESQPGIIDWPVDHAEEAAVHVVSPHCLELSESGEWRPSGGLSTFSRDSAGSIVAIGRERGRRWFIVENLLDGSIVDSTTEVYRIEVANGSQNTLAPLVHGSCKMVGLANDSTVYLATHEPGRSTLLAAKGASCSEITSHDASTIVFGIAEVPTDGQRVWYRHNSDLLSARLSDFVASGPLNPSRRAENHVRKALGDGIEVAYVPED